MAADIIGLTRVSGPRLLIALDPGLGAIRGAGTSSKLRSHANGASIVTINFPQLVLWTIILIILVIALLGGFSGIGGGPFYGTGAALSRTSAAQANRSKDGPILTRDCDPARSVEVRLIRSRPRFAIKLWEFIEQIIRGELMRRGMVVNHYVRLLMPAFRADEYLGIQFEDRVGRLNQLEPQFAIAEVAVQRGWRLDKVTHVISFRSICFGARKRDAQTGPGQ